MSSKLSGLLWLACLLASCQSAAIVSDAPCEREIRVDGDFPGGNIIVESIEGNTVRLHQDLRDTEGFWFYWCFRVRGAEGRTLRFEFMGGDVLGVHGPAVSTDGGKSWAWLGRDVVDGVSFRYRFSNDASETRFAMGVPYTERNLTAFLERHAGNPHLRVGELCRTRKGRGVEFLSVGKIDGEPDHRVLVTARHHACEAMASYALEGVVDAVLGGTDDGRWLREHVELLVVPLVDKDGVEDGDQGKNRRPHDPNRDYAGESIYPSVRAIRDLVPSWSADKLRIALDLHCPYIRGAHDHVVYGVGTPDPERWSRLQAFGKVLERERQGEIPYRESDNLPFGAAWNTYRGPLESMARWAGKLPGVEVASTLEVPYAEARGVVVTAERARSLGHDIARAIRVYLE